MKREDRCCANCEWCISPELEEEIVREQRYKQNDPRKPQAGDCILGINHDRRYVCSEHIYYDE